MSGAKDLKNYLFENVVVFRKALVISCGGLKLFFMTLPALAPPNEDRSEETVNK